MIVTKKINTPEELSRMVWGGAEDRVKYMTLEELGKVLRILEELHPEGMTETELNDFIWFEEDTYARWLGYGSFDDLMNERKTI